MTTGRLVAGHYHLVEQIGEGGMGTVDRGFDERLRPVRRHQVSFRRSRPRSRAAAPLYERSARGLVAAHEADIIHRDIKPENIMVRRDGCVKCIVCR